VLSQSFEALLKRLQGAGTRFVTLGEVAAAQGPCAPEATFAMGELLGRAGLVALQG